MGSVSLKQIGVLFGVILISLPLELPLYYGNLSIYIDSYFISKVGIEDHPSASMWPICLFIIAMSASVTFSGYLSKTSWPWTTTFIGVVLFNACLYVTYFSVQSSFLAMIITLTVLAGLASGVPYSMSTLYGMTWFPERTGVVISAIYFSRGMGGFILNMAITFYINPRNEQPDLKGGASIYFSQKDILSRVPCAFLVIGVISSVSQILGLLMVRHHPQFSTNEDMEASVLLKSEFSVEKPTGGTNEEHNEKQTALCSQYLSSDEDNSSTPSHESAKRSRGHELPRTDVTPRQMLKSPIFYLLAISFSLLVLGLDVSETYYKQFGAVFISDDFFLTDVGFSLSIMVGVSRAAWGPIVDHIGPKLSLFIISSVHTVMAAFWFFTPMVNKWLFLFWTLTDQAFINGIFTPFNVLVIIYFGRTNYITNYGVLLISNCIVQVLSPAFVNYIIMEFNYFWLFFCVAVASFLNIATSILFLSQP